MLEFALAWAVLFQVLGGVYQFGYTYYVYNSLENNTRAAARYAAGRTYDSVNATPTSTYRTAVQNMLVYGQPTASAQPVAPNLTPANVRVTVAFSRNVPSQVTVEVFDYTINGIFGRLTLRNKPKASFPYIGRWSPVNN